MASKLGPKEKSDLNAPKMLAYLEAWQDDIQPLCEEFDKDGPSDGVDEVQDPQSYQEDGEIDDSDDESVPTDFEKKETGKRELLPRCDTRQT